MARQFKTTEIVWLSVLRGKSAQESREEAEREAGRPYKQRYIDGIRSRANGMIQERFLAHIGGWPLSLECLEEIVRHSARSNPPLSKNSLIELENSAGVLVEDVMRTHQRLLEQEIRRDAASAVFDVRRANLYRS